ncbi:Protease 2 [Hordeum vulgare]|nr:Protease 2 [Hordeum vulgare]
MADRTSLPSVEQMITIDASNAYSQLESEVEFHAPNAIRPPPTSQEYEVDVIASKEVILKDVDVDGDFDEVEEGFHGIDIGDLNAYIAQKEMDRELPSRRLYGYDLDDEGPQEELDEDGFTKEENQIHFELTGLKKRTHLFRDLSLAHKAVVDGGMRKTAVEPTPCPDLGEPRDENEDENAYLKKGLKFPSLPAMKVWLSDYTIRNHMPFYVEHSDINLRFTVKCVKADEGCIRKEAQVLEVVVGGGGGTGSTSARGGGGCTGSTSGRGGVGGRRGGTSVRGGGGGGRGSTSARGGGRPRRGSSSARGGGGPRRGMSSSGSMTRPSCLDQWDMPKKWMAVELDKIKEKDVPTPSCWCGDVCKSPPPLYKYFNWIDHEVPQRIQEAQYRDAMWRQCLFNESLARKEERERREKVKKEKKKREEEKKRKEKEGRQEERARKLARACDAQAEDEARDKKGKWPRTTQ